MIALRPRLARLKRDDSGSMALETAFVLPILLLLSLGGFEASMMIARQAELQSAAAEAAAVVRAVTPEDSAQRAQVRSIIASSTGIALANVTVSRVFRCGTATAYVNEDNCSSGDDAYEFIRVRIQDTYSPLWTHFGIGSALSYNVARTVQIG